MILFTIGVFVGLFAGIFVMSLLLVAARGGAEGGLHAPKKMDPSVHSRTDFAKGLYGNSR